MILTETSHARNYLRKWLGTDLLLTHAIRLGAANQENRAS